VRIAIFGLGYVGCVSGACLAQLGHDVIGVDANPAKVDMINKGQAPVIETGLQTLIAAVTSAGSFVATSDWERAVTEASVVFVCVGTPSRRNGSVSLDAVKRVAEQIGQAIAATPGYLVVAVRSTVPPGTVEQEIVPILERQSGKRAGVDFGVCMVPEFLREGSSVTDFFDPPKTVIGQLDERSGDTVAEVFKKIPGPVVRARLSVAEMLKYADNAFHALKVTFANEIGNIAKEVGCDSHAVMKIFCMDTKLNLSPYYLKPGFAFGGSCLPKDLRAITYKARMLDVPTPLLEAISVSNREQIAKVVRMLELYKGRSLGFLGLSFKHGTDDLRESPILHVIETMIGKGFDVTIYDEYVSIARLVGSNKEYIEQEIPHVASLMCASAKELVRESSVVIVSTRSDEFRDALKTELRPDHVVLDLVRVIEDPASLEGTYEGICW
jgi:GDP-mannose 6-dehydrogenase